jgi:hypothetical protein
MNITVVLQILSFLSSNKDQIKQLILSLEQAFVEGAALLGPTKEAAAKGYIAVATNTVDEIEAIWPIISPVFSAVVASVKGKTA